MTDTFFGRTLAMLADPSSTYAQTFDASPVLDLSIGEARYPLPAAVRAEVGDATRHVERLWYSTPQGEPALRSAYLRQLTREDGRGEVPASTDVLVTAGGKEAAWLAIRYLLHCHGGGAALVPNPGWEPYRLWLSAAGCPQVPYDPAALAADPASLPNLVTAAETRPTLLILNYPNNPTGTSVNQAGMNQIVATAAECGLAVVSDEVYRAFAPGGVSAALAPAFDPARDAVVDSCSKWLGVAGLRVGCSACPWESDGGLYLWCRTPDPDTLADPGVGDRARITSGAGFGSPEHFRLCIARAGLDPTRTAAAVVATLRER